MAVEAKAELAEQERNNAQLTSEVVASDVDGVASQRIIAFCPRVGLVHITYLAAVCAPLSRRWSA